MPVDRPPDEDPGWQFSPRMLAFMLPGYEQFFGRRRAVDTLAATRQAFTGFTGSLVLYGVVLFFLEPGQRDLKRSPGLALVFTAVAALNSLITPRLLEKPLEGTDFKALAASYQVRFFLRVAFAEFAALIGFVMFFVANEWWAYPLGVAVAAVGFARLAPTKANLAKDQADLRRRGNQLSLVAALRQPKAT